MSASNIDISELQRFEPLDSLDADKLNELANAASHINVRKGQSVTTATPKDKIAYLLLGEVEKSTSGNANQSIKANTPQARQALVTPQDRAHVTVKKNSTLLIIDHGLLDFLLSWGNSGGLVVDEIDADQNSANWMDGFMQSEAVHNLSPSNIQTLIAKIEPKEYQQNQVIFHQGDDPDFYYIVSSGRCAVMVEGKQLVELTTGEAFGEEALITNSKRNATIQMSEGGIVLRLTPPASCRWQVHDGNRLLPDM